MLSFLHPETDLKFRFATSVLPSAVIVTVSRHERGSYPPLTYTMAAASICYSGTTLSRKAEVEEIDVDRLRQ